VGVRGAGRGGGGGGGAKGDGRSRDGGHGAATVRKTVGEIKVGRQLGGLSCGERLRREAEEE
jgi:hypothetical protein